MADRSSDRDALWVPLLTHYRAGERSGGPARVDSGRMAAQIHAISSAVRQFLHADGATAQAQQLSSIVAVIIEALFEAASHLPFGNPFSNANRAADHLLATGASWRESPLPLTVNGNSLPTEFISTVGDIIGHLPTIGTNGYLRSE
jgi:4-hydroxy-tetrahydrodipicolinate synthase